MAADSWEAVKRRFAALAGHERRMDATRGELAAKSGPDLARAQIAQARVWGTRLRDVLDDDPAAAAGLRALLADLAATPAATAGPLHQHAQADRGSNAVTVSGNTGEVYVGVGKVDKRRLRIFLFPITFFVQVARRIATAHPAAAATAAVVVVGGGVAGGLALAHAAQSSPLSAMVGSWQGTYTCAQGLTGVQLQIAPEKAGAVPVTLSFYPVPANPAVPQGSAAYRGTLASGTVHLTPVAWIHQPAGYTLNEWAGALPAAGRDAFSGTVAGCATFSLQRVQNEPAPSDASGTWAGTYTCAQGLTGLRLAIRPGTGNALAATFSFHAVPSNPSVPSGSFAMTGFVDPAGFFLDQSQWIKQPPGYAMVNVAGKLPPPDGKTLTGSVIGCSPITLTKT